MLQRLIGSASGVWDVTFGRDAAEAALRKEIDALPARGISTTPIQVFDVCRLYEVDRRPGTGVTLVVHGCGVNDEAATLLRRKIREAGLSGVTYLLRWNTPDILTEAVASGTDGVHRATDLAIAAPTPLGITVASLLGLYATVSGLQSGARHAYAIARRDAQTVAERFDDVLDAIPEASNGPVNVIGHSMGARLVSCALANEAVAARVGDVVLMGSVDEETPVATGRMINVYSRSDHALENLGITLGNGKVDDDRIEHREVDCGHHGYWSRLRSVVPRSWRAPRDLTAKRELPTVPTERGLRGYEVFAAQQG